MNIWVKRYLILTICFLIALLPTLSIMQSFDVLKGDKAKLIFWLVILVLAIVYYGLMTYFMLRKKSDK